MAVEKNTPSILVRARTYYRKKGFRSFFQRIVQTFQEWNLPERIAIQVHRKRIAIRRRSQRGKTEAFSATPVLSQRKDLALLFMHIPKTAGTSIRSLLESPFAAHERAYLYNESWGISLEAFRNLPNKEKEQFRLVCGHFNFGVHEWMPQEARYITILRDPVERVISLYHFIPNQPFLPGFEELLAPPVVEIRVQALAATERRNALFASQPLENDPDLFFG